MASGDGERAHPRGRDLAALSLGALGVVYGDIGTSPLYALRECFRGPHAVAADEANVLGILSLVVWSLVVVISVKYLVFVMRADNRGEGGIMALMALVRHPRPGGRSSYLLIALGLFGAALLYGDGMITPAISVLSAVEGLQETAHGMHGVVVPITVLVLLGLFAIQRRGSAGIGSIFGPVMVAWFAVIAVLGAAGIAADPSVLRAVDPMYAARFFAAHGGHAFLALGAVFLVVTGGEALYADMGHFGARPIRLVWFALVLPALLLNYFGQGALLLTRPDAAANPFYRLAPDWARLPLVALATAATIIASQAVISGAFSLTRQAIQLGYAPRLTIRHTSSREIGQIYVPFVNRVLAIATIALVLGFGSSSALAAAYGVAVTTTMVITTLLLHRVAREKWGWKPVPAAAVAATFLVVDCAFFGANIVKVGQGGWVPLVVAGAVFVLMTTWRSGRAILNRKLLQQALPFELLRADIARVKAPRVKGTAVYMSREPEGVPPALLHNFKHNKVLHERIVFLTILTEEVPFVPEDERVEVRTLGDGFFRVIAHYGFQEGADVPALLARVDEPGLAFPPGDTSFFLSKENVVATNLPGMALWREKLFAVMLRNAGAATSFFCLPPDRVVELGAHVEI